MDTKQHAAKTVLIFSTAYLPFIGGAELAVQNITDRVTDLAFVLITARMNRNLAREEKIGNVLVYRLGFGFLFDKWLLPFLGFFKACALARNWKLLARRSESVGGEIKNCEFILWGIMASQGSIAAYLFKKIHPRVPFVLTLQEGDPERHLLSGRAGLMGFFVRRIIRSADQLQVISNYLKDIALRCGATAPIAVVPNGVDIEKFKIKSEKSDIAIQNLKSRLGIAEREKVIITVSRLAEKNAVDLTIRALALLRSRGKSVKLVVVGIGARAARLKALARKLNVEDAVIWTGLVDYNALPDHLVLADVFVRPSRSEGLGSAFIEAMAAGVPIIGTPVGGIPGFLRDGETGLFVRVDDANDLAEKIKNIFDNDELRDRLVRNAARLVRERYRWDDIAERLGDLLRLPMPLRVLIATPLFPPEIGGPATYAKLLCEEFPRLGFIVAILPFSRVRHLPYIIRHAIYFFYVLREGGCADIIYAQDPLGVGLPSGVAAKMLRKKFIVKIVGDRAWETAVQKFGVRDALDDFIRRKNYGIGIRLLRFGQYVAATLADRIVVPSAYLARIVSLWGIARGRITVIYNAYIPVKTPPRAAKNALGRGPIMVSAGRLVSWKGFDALIALMPALLKKWPTLKLLIVGDGPERENLKSGIRELHLEKHVKLTGTLNRDALYRTLLAGDLFVLYTAYEGFSHQLLEAMDAGIPIITTRVGGNTELVKDGENGLLVEYGDTSALSGAIDRVLSERQLKKQLAARAKETLERFRKERMLRELADMLQSI